MPAGTGAVAAVVLTDTPLECVGQPNDRDIGTDFGNDISTNTRRLRAPCNATGILRAPACEMGFDWQSLPGTCRDGPFGLYRWPHPGGEP